MCFFDIIYMVHILLCSIDDEDLDILTCFSLCIIREAASRTPMGMPPPTPVKQDANVPPRTPVGTPPPTPATRGAAQPMTPEVRDAHVKAE